MIKQILNVKAVLPCGVENDFAVAYENGKIINIGKEPLKNVENIDGEGRYLFAGFIDVHCHGGAGYDFMDATEEEMLKISRFHLLHGTTTLMPTTMTDKWENIYSVLDKLKNVYGGKNPLTLYGVHLEGPWLSAKNSGAQEPEKMDEPSVERLTRLLNDYPFIKRISVAPELKNGMLIGREGAKRGIVMSIAHTDADFDCVDEARKNGYSLMTHLYSGMNGVTRKNAYRTAGAVEAGLYFDDLFVEIIADGKHLPSGLLKLVYKVKGADKICLITDAMRASGLKDGESSVLGRKDDGVPVIVEDGVAKMPDRQNFAGSVATTDRLIRTMISAGVPVEKASEAASTTPARIFGLNDRGSIEVGKRADFVLTDDEFFVKGVILNGNEIK